MKSFNAIYRSTHLKEIEQYVQKDEVIDRPAVKAFLLSKLHALKPDFEKILITDPDTYRKYEDLDRALRGYH
jgi:hypothetical protein